jgi:hypothetical protein
MTPEARAARSLNRWHTTDPDLVALIAETIRAAVEEEREACVTICEEQKDAAGAGVMFVDEGDRAAFEDGWLTGADQCLVNIRARGFDEGDK